MAFENPLLKPSNTRQAALKYLWSDEPTGDTVVNTGSSSSGSVVADAFDVGNLTTDAVAKAINISNNGGEYNPNDTTDYSLEAIQNPGDAWRAFDKYGSKAIGLLGMLGLPFAGSIRASAEQNFANNFGNMIGAYVEPFGGQLPDGRNPFFAGALAAIPVIGGKFEADNVESLRALRDQFSNDENIRGYFAGGVDPGVGKIVAGTVQDYNTLSPDAYGEKANQVQNKIYDYVTKGYELGDAENLAAIDFGVNYQVPAVATPVKETPLATPTEIAPNFPPSFTKTGTGLIYTDPSAVGPQLPNEYIPGLFTSTPVATPAPAPIVGTSDNGGKGTPTSQTGGIVTSGDGSFVRSGDGSVVTWGDYSAPSVAPAGNNPDEASSSDSGGGSSKIVCTAMNESYGFGSFRNRIWLAYAAKHLTKEHEKGYHTLFLPLVDIAYRKQTIISKPLRAVLENIARHRSADLRAEMRGSKRDTIGRVYRAILEPLCYFVGKYK
jgi:hypothetical protein